MTVATFHTLSSIVGDEVSIRRLQIRLSKLHYFFISSVHFKTTMSSRSKTAERLVHVWLSSPRSYAAHTLTAISVVAIVTTLYHTVARKAALV